MNAIRADKLQIIKSKKVILDRLRFQVQPGTVTGLIGPSGSGKTTLMRTIVGAQKITDGTLSVLGKPAGDTYLSSRIGYVTQSPAVYSDITVEENLEYFGSLVGTTRENITGILTDVDLLPQRKQIVASLSGGQHARVSLAVALLGTPELLILDEPTVGLDPILRDDLWSMFQRLADQGKTLLISSHVMDEAERCEELILLRDGSILWNDTRQELLATTKTASVGDAFVRAIKGAER